jgi:uncharacterized membrane protein YkvI
MIEALKGMLSSKKALAAFGGGLMSVLAKVGVDAPVGVIYGLLGLLSAYIVGQGMADWGKEAKAIEAQAKAGETNA